MITESLYALAETVMIFLVLKGSLNQITLKEYYLNQILLKE